VVIIVVNVLNVLEDGVFSVWEPEFELLFF
jgi:hypothetical protein